MVHFANGFTLPAEKVTEQGKYYLLEYAGRAYAVRKEDVTRIDRPKG